MRAPLRVRHGVRDEGVRAGLGGGPLHEAALGGGQAEHLAATAQLLAPVLASLRERQGASAGAAATSEQLADSGWVANRWCELLPMPMDLKQRMMELDNPLVRLELVADMLESTGIAPDF